MRYLKYIITLLCFGNLANAQHQFKGHIDNERWQSQVYLSVIDDYRTVDGINDEQIISKASTDVKGYFEFNGDQLDNEQKIYKLHVDNCTTYNQSGNHFDGHCADSKAILFIAKNRDTIAFPLSFDAQMFCDIESNNPKTAAFIKIDSLKEEMKYSYSEFRSKASRDLNNKKWFKTLQSFGEALDEPLAELYIYEFLSNRSHQFHDYYLEDLKSNSYYNDLLKRLNKSYPNASYTKQYETELLSDQLIASPSQLEENSGFNWTILLIVALVLSVLFNFWLIISAKRKKAQKHVDAKELLTKQEQNVLDLLLDDNSNKAIAESLFVSVSTVKTHVNNVYRKLNVKSRDELKSLYSK